MIRIKQSRGVTVHIAAGWTEAMNTTGKNTRQQYMDQSNGRENGDTGQTMSDEAIEAKLNELVEKWRETADVGNEMGDNMYAAGLRGCANELEKAVEEADLD